MVEDDEWFIGGFEEVEEVLGGDDGSEGEEREWVGEEREGDDGGEECEVVDVEVGVVFVEVGGGVGERFWFGEGGVVDEFGLGVVLGKVVVNLVVEVCDEGVEGWGGSGGLGRLSGGWCGGREGGGLRVGGWDDWWG